MARFEVEMLKSGDEGEYEVKSWEAEVIEPYMLKELIDYMPEGCAILIRKVEEK